MGVWDKIKRGATAVATGGLSETGIGGRLLGTSSTKADELSEQAAAAMVQSNANAQNAYDLALQQAAAAGLIQGPQAITATSVGVPTIQAATADTNNILNTADPRVQAYLATAQKYDPSLAVAAGATGNMVGYDAAQATAQDVTGRMTSYAPELAEATLAGPAQLASIDRVGTAVTAPGMEPAALSQFGGMDQTYVPSVGTETRGEQLDAARAIADSPSSAAAQFASSFDKATNDALAVAGQARGNERAGARREALVQMALKGAAGAEGAAATAAQEDTAKRAAYAQALQGVRGADVQVAQTQATIDAQRAQTVAQLKTAIEQGNTAAVNALKAQAANLDLEAQKATVTAGLQQQQTEASLEAQNAREQNAIETSNAALSTNVNVGNAAAGTKAAADLANAQNLSVQADAERAAAVSKANAEFQTKAAAELAAAKNQAAREYAAAATGTSTTNAAAKTTAAADYAKTVNAMGSEYATAQNAASLAKAQLDAQRAEGNAGRAATVATSDAQNKTSAAIAQGQAALTAGTATSGNALDASKATATNYLDTQRIQQAGTTSAIQGMNTAAGTQGSNAGAVVGAQKAEAEAQAKQDAALVGAVSSVGAAGMKSDERVKTDIKQPSDAEINEVADKLAAYKTWRYKPGVEDGGAREHGGWMAQDLEKTELGRKFVGEDENGIKNVDMLSLAGLMASVAARSMRKTKDRRSST